MRNHIQNRCEWLHVTWSSWIIMTKILMELCVSFLWGKYENNFLQRRLAAYWVEAWWYDVWRIEYGGKPRRDVTWPIFALFCSQIHSSLFFNSALYNLPCGCGEGVTFVDCIFWVIMTIGFWIGLSRKRHQQTLEDKMKWEFSLFLTLSSYLSSISGNSCVFFVVVASANDGSFFWVILNLELCTKISSPHSFSQDSLLLIYVLPHHPLFDFHHFCNPFPVLTFVCTEHFEQFLILCLDLQMDRYELSKYLVNKYT